MRQELLWIGPVSADVITTAEGRRGSVPFTWPKPDLLWTLIGAADPEKTPELPIVPSHANNAFLEDHIHDWIVRGGVLYYYSRVVDLTRNGNWLLLEYKT